MPAATPAPPPAANAGRRATWWQRDDLYYDSEGHLRFAGERTADLARRTGTPAFVYSGARLSANVTRLRAVLGALGPPPPRLHFAMKSNRHPAVLAHLHALGVGLDVCSPGEVRHALKCGFAVDELSFTAGSLSRADFAALADWPDLWINADSLSALPHLAALSRRRSLGLRINPAAGLGYRMNPRVRYAGAKPTKFGVYLDRFAEALAVARDLGLEIAGLHCHAGCGFLTPQLPELEDVLVRLGVFLDAAPRVRRLNLGGGLGVPLAAGDAPLDLTAWAGLVRRHFGGRSLLLEFEPGDYLVKDAGVLLTEVTQIEEKGGRVFVGLNAGCNVHPEPAFYGLPLEPAPAFRRPGPPRPVTLAGNINEALDLWAEEVPLPPLAEGDVVCLLNAGGYGAAMASAHCLRTEWTEHFLPPTPDPPPVGAEILAAANQRAWDTLYRSTPELVWGSSALPFLDDFLADLRQALRRPSRLLDAGAGEGRNLPLLLQCGADEVHAFDSSAHALAKIPAGLLPRVQCRTGDLRATGYPESHFDAIALLDVVETLPDSPAVLRELARILRPGGLLLCNIPGPDDGIAGRDMQALGRNAFLYRNTYYYRFIERPEAESLLVGAGFELLRSCRCQWREAAHPAFRPGEHQHVSRILLARRPVPPG